jgi:CubicO group peptidase (beta-lactamase class C family)
MLASIPTDSPFFRAAPPAVQPTAEFCNRSDVLTADIPAGSTLTARAVARMYAAVMDEVDGVGLISSERLREVTNIAFSGIDELMGNPVEWGLGYAIGRPGVSPQQAPTWFGMAGSGGTAAYADTGTGLAIALTKTTISYGQFNAFGQVVDIVTRALAR